MKTPFLSHNSKDKPDVEKIAQKLLNTNKIKPWLDIWNLAPGDIWQEAIEDALDQCDSCIVFLGSNGVGPWQNEEMRVAIQRRIEDKSKDFKVIPVMLPKSKKAAKLPSFLQRATWVEFKDSIEENLPFEKLVHGIIGSTPYPNKKKLNP